MSHTGPRGRSRPASHFDAHLHYNWEPVAHFPLQQVLTLFRRQNVTGILANSRPNDGTRALVGLALASGASPEAVDAADIGSGSYG